MTTLNTPAWLLESPAIQETMRKHNCTAMQARDILAEHDVDAWGNDIVRDEMEVDDDDE